MIRRRSPKRKQTNELHRKLLGLEEGIFSQNLFLFWPQKHHTLINNERAQQQHQQQPWRWRRKHPRGGLRYFRTLPPHHVDYLCRGGYCDGCGSFLLGWWRWWFQGCDHQMDWTSRWSFFHPCSQVLGVAAHLCERPAGGPRNDGYRSCRIGGLEDK